MENIPIVVAAYNRPQALQRLLTSLNKSHFTSNVKLIISIDHGNKNTDVVSVAQLFNWKHGEKKVIIQETHLGLKKHILFCGRISTHYDGIILLEDDLYVSPSFYDYVIKVHARYSSHSEIAGVALYSHQYNETADRPFVAINDGYDVFFAKIACSWGQSWTSKQWNDFETWYESNQALDLSNDADLPHDVRSWPDTSWKKYFVKYISQENKFFVYPRVSFCTNFGDAGQHHTGTSIFQVPLQLGQPNYNLPDFHQSSSKYDSFCEILPEVLKKYNNKLVEFDFEVDLYGQKQKNQLKAKYILTSQYVSNVLFSFARELKPHEANIIEDICGKEIFFSYTKELSAYRLLLFCRLPAAFKKKVKGALYKITKLSFQ